MGPKLATSIQALHCSHHLPPLSHMHGNEGHELSPTQYCTLSSRLLVKGVSSQQRKQAFCNFALIMQASEEEHSTIA